MTGVILPREPASRIAQHGAAVPQLRYSRLRTRGRNLYRILAGGSKVAGGTARTFEIAPDGQRFSMIKLDDSDRAQAPQNLVVVQSWFDHRAS
jgi:hypothetical protein